jgi:hypothetical protein
MLQAVESIGEKKRKGEKDSEFWAALQKHKIIKSMETDECWEELRAVTGFQGKPQLDLVRVWAHQFVGGKQLHSHLEHVMAAHLKSLVGEGELQAIDTQGLTWATIYKYARTNRDIDGDLAKLRKSRREGAVTQAGGPSREIKEGTIGEATTASTEWEKEVGVNETSAASLEREKSNEDGDDETNDGQGDERPPTTQSDAMDLEMPVDAILRTAADTATEDDASDLEVEITKVEEAAEPPLTLAKLVKLRSSDLVNRDAKWQDETDKLRTLQSLAMLAWRKLGHGPSRTIGLHILVHSCTVEKVPDKTRTLTALRISAKAEEHSVIILATSAAPPLESKGARDTLMLRRDWEIYHVDGDEDGRQLLHAFVNQPSHALATVARLAQHCGDGNRIWSRLLVEKPQSRFGAIFQLPMARGMDTLSLIKEINMSDNAFVGSAVAGCSLMQALMQQTGMTSHAIGNALMQELEQPHINTRSRACTNTLLQVKGELKRVTEWIRVRQENPATRDQEAPPMPILTMLCDIFPRVIVASMKHSIELSAMNYPINTDNDLTSSSPQQQHTIVIMSMNGATKRTSNALNEVLNNKGLPAGKSWARMLTMLMLLANAGSQVTSTWSPAPTLPGGSQGREWGIARQEITGGAREPARLPDTAPPASAQAVAYLWTQARKLVNKAMHALNGNSMQAEAGKDVAMTEKEDPPPGSGLVAELPPAAGKMDVDKGGDLAGDKVEASASGDMAAWIQKDTETRAAYESEIKAAIGKPKERKTAQPKQEQQAAGDMIAFPPLEWETLSKIVNTSTWHREPSEKNLQDTASMLAKETMRRGQLVMAELDPAPHSEKTYHNLARVIVSNFSWTEAVPGAWAESPRPREGGSTHSLPLNLHVGGIPFTEGAAEVRAQLGAKIELASEMMRMTSMTRKCIQQYEKPPRGSLQTLQVTVEAQPTVGTWRLLAATKHLTYLDRKSVEHRLSVELQDDPRARLHTDTGDLRMALKLMGLSEPQAACMIHHFLTELGCEGITQIRFDHTAKSNGNAWADRAPIEWWHREGGIILAMASDAAIETLQRHVLETGGLNIAFSDPPEAPVLYTGAQREAVEELEESKRPLTLRIDGGSVRDLKPRPGMAVALRAKNNKGPGAGGERSTWMDDRVRHMQSSGIPCMAIKIVPASPEHAKALSAPSCTLAWPGRARMEILNALSKKNIEATSVEVHANDSLAGGCIIVLKKSDFVEAGLITQAINECTIPISGLVGSVKLAATRIAIAQPKPKDPAEGEDGWQTIPSKGAGRGTTPKGPGGQKAQAESAVAAYHGRHGAAAGTDAEAIKTLLATSQVQQQQITELTALVTSLSNTLKSLMPPTEEGAQATPSPARGRSSKKQKGEGGDGGNGVPPPGSAQ